MTQNRGSWNRSHEAYWKEAVQVLPNNQTLFQEKLLDKIKDFSSEHGIRLKIQESTREFLDEDHIGQLFEISLIKENVVKVWIYPRMADFESVQEHCVYEYWGYLKPEELLRNFMKDLKRMYKLAT